jgi:hypothetical protein
MAAELEDITSPATLADPSLSTPGPSRWMAFITEPLRVTGTELPGNVLLMAKVVTLAFLATGQFRLLSWHFLPFLTFFDRLSSPAVFHWTLVTIFLGAASLLFFNRYVRVCCLVLGGVILISLLSSRTYFENNRTYCACLLILAGLCAKSQKPWPLRCQVVLVYFGAALNKLLEPDWRSGQFFAYWFGQIHHPNMWTQVSAMIPAMPLAQFVCWVTIITEFVLVAGFLVPRWYSWSIWLGAVYHTALLVVMNSTFGMFYYAMLASYLAFVEWPERLPEVRYDSNYRMCNSAGRLFSWFDTAGLFTWTKEGSTHEDNLVSKPRSCLLLVDNGNTYSGFDAFKKMLLWNPLAYFGYVILLGRQPRLFQYHRWFAAAVLIAFSPVLASLGRAVYRWGVHRQQLPTTATTKKSAAKDDARP